GGQAHLPPARLGELRGGPVHLKQRRGAPCERPGPCRGGRVPPAAFRLRLPESRHLPDQAWAEGGGQRRRLLLHARGACPPRRGRAGGGRRLPQRGPLGQRGLPARSAATAHTSPAPGFLPQGPSPTLAGGAARVPARSATPSPGPGETPTTR